MPVVTLSSRSALSASQFGPSVSVTPGLTQRPVAVVVALSPRTVVTPAVSAPPPRSSVVSELIVNGLDPSGGVADGMMNVVSMAPVLRIWVSLPDRPATRQIPPFPPAPTLPLPPSDLNVAVPGVSSTMTAPPNSVTTVGVGNPPPPLPPQAGMMATAVSRNRRRFTDGPLFVSLVSFMASEADGPSGQGNGTSVHAHGSLDADGRSGPRLHVDGSGQGRRREAVVRADGDLGAGASPGADVAVVGQGQPRQEEEDG